MKNLTGRQIKIKIILPAVIIFLTGLVLVIAGTFYMQSRHLNQDVLAVLDSTERLYRSHLDSDMQMMEGALLYIKDDKRVQQAWLNKDRHLLYELCRKNFASLQQNQRITHLYFTDLDKKVFLRIHNPNKFGDTLDRYTTNEALRTQKRSVGVEFGIHHNFTLRNVHPWFIDGKMVGFVEMGEEIDHLLPHVADLLGAQVFATFDKSLLSREKWEKGIRLYGHDTRWDILEHSVVIGKTMEKVPADLDPYLNRQGDTEGDLFSVEDGTIEYLGGYVELHDVSNKKVGKLVVIKDVTQNRNEVLRYVFFIFIGGVTLFVVVIFIVVTYVNVISGRLDYYHRQLKDAAYIDSLTGIGNRRYLIDRSKMFFIEKQTGVTFLLDIDLFKNVNDQYGHDHGDEVLKRFSTEIENFVRQGDIFARFGGEEFAVLLPGCQLDIALVKAEKIRQAIEALKIDSPLGLIEITVSIGVYENKAGDSLKTVMKRADLALYQAKENGRNRIEVYQPTLENS